MNRNDFPILNEKVYGKTLVYLDNAATTQKPQVVIDALSDYYRRINSNIHRGVHCLSQLATNEFEQAREAVRQYIHAASTQEVIFTRGATESINLVAASFGRTYLHAGDEVIVSEMEHHSNIVPWQLACEDRGATLKVLPFNDKGELMLRELETLITERTKIVAVAHVSNSLGTVNPIEEVIRIAHSHNVPVLIDGAQAVAHCPVDVQALDCDFYCFSGHKMYAPMGIGVMYGKAQWLNEMQPYQGGGEMIKDVTFEKTTYNELPYKFEAGTPSVGDVIGLRKAIEYIGGIGLVNIAAYEQELLAYTTEKLARIDGMRFIGEASHKTGVISFLVGDTHPYDMGVLLDHQGIAVRTGHHCTQPVMTHFGIPGTIRASFALYNTFEEADALVAAVERAKAMLS
ncbi:MAG: cysteine desulfurase [Bacteroidales bacterium]|nr:cysteine desulfurase [Bacteroidales bacterium]